MKPTRILFILFLLLATSLNGKGVIEFFGSEANDFQEGANHIRFSKDQSYIKFMQFRDGAEVPFNKFEEWARRNFKISKDFGLLHLESSSDELGFSHHRFQQTFKGYPIPYSMLIVHEKNNLVKSFNGDYRLNISSSSNVILSGNAARSIALNIHNGQKYKWESDFEESLIKRLKKDPNATFFPKGELVWMPEKGKWYEEELTLVYMFDIYSDIPLSKVVYYINAQNGNLLFSEDKLRHADAPGTAVTAYSGTQAIIADDFGGSFRLREVGRGGGIETYNCQTGTNYGSAVDFTDSDNFWNNVNGAMDEVATDAHWGAEMTYDYFFSIHGRNSIDDAGFPLLSYVHYDQNFSNAFWDGTRMTYGDGNGTPFMALDVCGHEVTHGLTENTANLIYQNEWGALNESFSDIFGTAIEKFARPTNWNWHIGEDLYGGNSWMRDMEDPKSLGDPDTYFGVNWYSGTGDNGGVHTNSGVQNHWYYMMVVGETGVNDHGDSYSITGLGGQVADDITFRNLTVYLTPVSEYEDSRFYSIQSAIDLYGPCTPEVETTTDAWFAAGIGNSYSPTVTADFSANINTTCVAPQAIVFINQSVNAGSFTWDFGDGNTSTDYSPVHTYNGYGTFSVSLVVDGGACGTDSQVYTDFINLDPGNTCVVFLDPTGVNSTQNSCTGILYDSGGANNNYGDNTTTSITISPTGAANVTLDFSVFAFESDYDYLYIYDGPTTGSPLIGQFDGFTLPMGGSITSTGPSITVEQYSDAFVNEEGFELTWTCYIPNSPPASDFQANELANCTGNITFQDLSLNVPSNWLWDFGDGNTSSLQNPSHTYAGPGVYDVVLIASNNFGSDTILKTAYINIYTPPQPNAVGASRCDPGNLSLSALGMGPFEWFDTPSGGTPIGSGNSFNTGILSNTTTYYVEEIVAASSQFVGPVDNLIGTGANFNSIDRKLIFDVMSACVLKSVWVSATGAGSRTIEWRDSNSNMIDSKTVYVPAGTTRVNLDFNLIPGTGYELGAAGNVNLFRNDGGAVFPYDISGLVSITGTDAGQPGYYYYFYDWEIVPDFCKSERAPVVAEILPMIAPLIQPSGNVTICTGSSVTISATGPQGTYLWSNGQTGQSIIVSTPGTYSVELSNGNGCVASSQTVTVSVGNSLIPVVTTTGGTGICPGGTLTLGVFPEVQGYLYQWSNGSTTPSVTISQPGTYSVSVSDGLGCGGNSNAVVVTNLQGPTVSIASSSTPTICEGETIDINAFGTATTYLWNTGETTSSIVVSESGSYFVEGFDENGCSSISTSISVTVLSAPLVNITSSGNSIVCAGEEVVLSSSNISGDLLWSTGETTGNISVATAGNYTLELTDPNTGCIGNSNINVSSSSYAIPEVSLSGPAEFCEGDEVVLTAPLVGMPTWSTGETTPSITVNSSQSVVLLMNYPDGCSSSSESVELTMHNQPNGSFSYTENALVVSFSNQSFGGDTYFWDFGDGFSSVAENPNHAFPAEGSYIVTQIVSEGPCSDTVVQEINVSLVGMESDISFTDIKVFPTPITSNLNIEMDLPREDNLSISVYDLLGKKVVDVFEGRSGHGVFKTKWEPSESVAAGTYFLKINYGNNRHVRKVVLIQ